MRFNASRNHRIAANRPWCVAARHPASPPVRARDALQRIASARELRPFDIPVSPG